MKRLFFFFFLFSQAFATQDSIVLFEDGFKSLAGVWSISSHKPKSPSVIIWFHGGMQNANCQKGLVAGKGLFELLNDSNTIVASPSACQNNHWLSPSLTSITDKLIDSLERHFKFSIQEVHLAGVSDGTLGVLAYSINGKRKVLSRLLISSNLSMLGDSKKISQIKKIKTGEWLFLQGGRDRLYPASHVLPWLYSFCESIGSSCNIVFDAEGEHDWSYWVQKHPNQIRHFRFSKLP